MKELHTAINALGFEEDPFFTFTDISKAHQVMNELTNADIKFKCKLIFPSEKAQDSAFTALRFSDLNESPIEETYHFLHKQEE